MAAIELWNTSLWGDANIVSYYRFNTGALVTDSKGSNTLTNNNSVAETASGKFGYGADFGNPNTTKTFSSTSSYSVTGQTFSMSCWWKCAQLPASEDTDNIMYFRNNGKGNFIIRYYVSGSTKYVGFIRNNGLTQEGNYTVHDPGTSNFHHYVLTCNGTTMYGYIDKTQVGPYTVSEVANGTDTGLVLGSGSPGVMDDVAFFNDVLSSTEVTALYDGTLAYYHHQSNADTFTLSESSSRAYFFSRSLSDTMTLSESTVRSQGFGKLFSDSFSLSAIASTFRGIWTKKSPSTTSWTEKTNSLSTFSEESPTTTTWTEKTTLNQG